MRRRGREGVGVALGVKRHIPILEKPSISFDIIVSIFLESLCGMQTRIPSQLMHEF